MIRIKRLIKSFLYAFRGLFLVAKEEQNVRLQFFIGVSVVFLGIFLRIKKYDFLILLILIFLVVLTEIINSAIERISDSLKPRLDKYVKEIKDIMAGAVMLVSILSLTVGFIIFVPYILDFYEKIF